MTVVRVTTRRAVVRVTKTGGLNPGGTVIIRPKVGSTVRISRFGIQGPPGQNALVEGGSVATVTWSPPTAQDIWLIVHNLGKYPSVTVVDGDMRVVYPDVAYLDNNIVELRFAFAMQGYAYLN